MRNKIMKLIEDIEYYKNHNSEAWFIIGFIEQQLKYLIMEIESERLVKERNERYGR